MHLYLCHFDCHISWVQLVKSNCVVCTAPPGNRLHINSSFSFVKQDVFMWGRESKGYCWQHLCKFLMTMSSCFGSRQCNRLTIRFIMSDLTNRAGLSSFGEQCTINNNLAARWWNVKVKCLLAVAGPDVIHLFFLWKNFSICFNHTNSIHNHPAERFCPGMKNASTCYRDIKRRKDDYDTQCM